MKYTIKPYGALCSLKIFKINGKNAYKEDFVDQFDAYPELAEPYGCGDMIGEVIPASREVLEKYGITENEYQEIAEKVADAVSFGNCGWCI